MSTRPYGIPLPSEVRPAAVIARLPERGGALWGDWFGGGTALFDQPLVVVEPENAADGFGLLDELPFDQLRATEEPELSPPRFPEPVEGLIGGGWLALLGYRPGHSRYAFHDSLLRWTERTGWVFESLGRPGQGDRDRAALERWRRRLAAVETAPAIAVGPFRTRRAAAATRDHHLAAVEAAIGRIGRGDFYQVNLCTRLHAATTSTPAAVFASVADRLRPGYAGLAGTVASFSPELFLRVEGRRVTTAPIKGTAPRTDDATDSPQLRTSTKDAAENVMIVDLMRNDLSRVCRPGTVAVSDLLGIQPHPGVWHLVSTVTGELRPEVGLADLLAATFPPGSVTGAPKISAERGIADLEPESRGAYTGALGFISPLAGAEFNVLIRSFEMSQGQLELGVGGGITVDSVPIREWYECLHKAAPLVAAAGSRLAPELSDEPGPPAPALTAEGVFESVLVADGRALRLADHLARLDRSCRELSANGLPENLAAQILSQLADAPVVARRAVRVAARPAASGLTVEVTSRELGPRVGACVLAHADRGHRSWRHKWQDRTALDAAERAVAPALPWFAGPDGSLAETSRGNLFLLGPDGVWRTPPLDEHLLPGVTRRAVLDLAPALDLDLRIERVFDPTEVEAAFWTSSLSGAVAVTALDGRPLADCTPLLTELNIRLGVS